MNALLEIARLSFAEAIRNRISYGLLAFVTLLLLASATLASVTMGRTELMIIDLGLGAISIMANLMAIIFTIQTLQQEREGRTLYVLLTRLQSRWHYIGGKYLGLCAVLGLQVVIMCLLLGGLAAIFGTFHWLSLMQATAATVLEVWLVTAIAVIFAQTSSLFLALLLTLSVDIAGRFTTVIHNLGTQSNNPTLRHLTEVIYYLLPNLERVNLRNGAGYIESFSWMQITTATAYACSEIALLIMVAIWIFQRRNLA
ncbi:MAG: ABC transporter permease subunit [Mariprofundales bacterium]|nr:ABC transporter permease subunit [Mariprofundales bacterium]